MRRFEVRIINRSYLGGYILKETPDPIPNSAVKLQWADDTATGGKVGRRQVFSQYLSSLS